MDTVIRLYVQLAAALRDTWEAYVAPRPRYALVTRSRRGAGLLEYALLAALAVILFIGIRTALAGRVGKLTSNVGNEIDSTNGSVVSGG